MFGLVTEAGSVVGSFRSGCWWQWLDVWRGDTLNMCQRKRGGDVAVDWRVKRKTMQGRWRTGILPTVYFIHTAQDLVEVDRRRF